MNDITSDSKTLDAQIVYSSHEISETLLLASEMTGELTAFETSGNQWVGVDLVYERAEKLIKASDKLEYVFTEEKLRSKATTVFSLLLSDSSYKYLPKLAERIHEISWHHTEDLLTEYSDGPSENRGECIKILQSLLVHGDKSTAKMGSIKDDLLVRIGKKIESDIHNINASELAFLLEHGTDEIALLAKTHLLSIFSSKNTFDKSISVINAPDFKKAEIKARDILAEYLNDIGLDGNRMITFWKRNRCSEDYDYDKKNDEYILETVKGNLNIINQLLSRGVSVSLLNRNYGITNFSRFPIDLLERQAKEPKRRCVFMIYPLTDHNSGIYSTSTKVDSFYKGLPKNVDVIVSEIDRSDKLKPMLLKLKSLFGKGIHGVVAGHGSYDGLQLGDGKKYSESHLTRFAFAPEPSDGLGGIFDECFEADAEIILISCSTGVTLENGPGGFARFATRHSRLTFIGPEHDSGVSKITSRMQGGKLVGIDVEYKDLNGPIRTMKYKNGALV